MEFCAICDSELEEIQELIEQGILVPENCTAQQTLWCFTINDIERCKRAKRLHRDLDLNWVAVALILELKDEVQQLQSQLSRVLK
ncbi:MAG TPA: chaperone modulatory protein CbpM [Coxiellaceae bacterium]|nr:chaperone modulatory protein CbpM [Coxiellaceae bacterium]